MDRNVQNLHETVTDRSGDGSEGRDIYFFTLNRNPLSNPSNSISKSIEIQDFHYKFPINNLTQICPKSNYPSKAILVWILTGFLIGILIGLLIRFSKESLDPYRDPHGDNRDISRDPYKGPYRDPYRDPYWDPYRDSYRDPYRNS